MKHHVFQASRSILAAALLVCLAAGCVEVEQVMIIRGDGGGAITLRYLVDEQLVAAQASAQKAITGMQTGEIPADKLSLIHI